MSSHQRSAARRSAARGVIGTSKPVGAALAALAVASFAHAGTIRADRSDQQYKDLANQAQFAAVGTYTAGGFFGSITLISDEWALTAAHVVDPNHDGQISDTELSGASMRFGTNTTRRATQVIVPVGVNGNRGWTGDINDGFDIALVHLSAAITTIAPAAIYTGFQELGKTITTVGYGQTGTGLTGANSASGTKRAGNNVIDRYVTFSNGATALRYDFDEPAPRTSPNQSGSTTPLDLEYMIGPGDSGGGTFLLDNGSWFLAGVTSGVYDSYAYPGAGTNNGSSYGDEALITRVSAYQQFIATNAPELAALMSVPEPASLAALAMAGAVLRRRRRA